MKSSKNLLAKLEPKLKGKKWYHQRFDGSPMFIFAIAEAETKKEKRKPKGTAGTLRAFFFGKGIVDWYIDMDDIKRGSKAIINLAKKNPKISTKLLKSWIKHEEKFEHYFWKIFPKVNLKKLNNNELLKLWDDSYYTYINRVTSSALIDHFALGTDELIGKMLRKEVGKIKKESEFTEIFSIATAPVHQSFINLAEIELLKIILRKSKQSLKQYQQKWFWSKNNYVKGQILRVNDFQKEISAWKKSGKDLKHELKQIENAPKVNKAKKAKLLKKYKLSPLLKTLIEISEDFTWWQDERKKSTYFNTHIGSSILKEISKRKGYNFEDLKYAVHNEIQGVFKNNKPSKQELKQRKNFGGILAASGMFQVVVGQQAKKLKSLVLEKKSSDEIKDFRGLSASTGRAIGKVTILKSAEEVNKVSKGDILVAVMTRPDYITAMKKAAAIVTNEGGITSHAAIVSRELGIPCIIGTKIATEVLKDGDKVEVNANHGLVKKL